MRSFCDFFLGQQVPAPEEQTALQALLQEHQLFHRLGDGLLQLLNRLVLALGDQLGHARRQTEQFEQRLERGQVPVLGPLDVLELSQFVHAGPGQLRQAGGVELLARNGEHQVAGVDQRGQDDRDPFGFEPQPVLGHVLHALVVLDQLGAVDHLAVALLLEQHRGCAWRTSIGRDRVVRRRAAPGHPAPRWPAWCGSARRWRAGRPARPGPGWCR